MNVLPGAMPRPALPRGLRTLVRPCAALLLAASALAGPPAPPAFTTWSDYGGGPDQSKYAVVEDLTRESVRDLEVAWTYPSGDDNAYQFNPVILGDTMIVLAKDSSLVALDAATGEERWIHANLRGINRRGINVWQSPDGREARLLFARQDYLQAIDAHTGQSILSFGREGAVDLREGLDRDPAQVPRVQSGTPGRVFENLLILGSSPGEGYFSAPGYIRAYDVITGEHVWTFHTVPHPGEPGYETWPPDAWRYVGGVNAWGELSLDAERGIVYVPLGSPTYDFYGADRHGANLYGSSLVALDARTGERLWHFQFVHHDLWDYDPTAAPQLVTVRHGGRTIDVVAQATKQGFLFAFDRVTGEPLWPIEERPVPPSDVPGEEAWPTQPFPTVLPPFGRQTITPDDVTEFFLTPDERKEFQDRIRAGRTGLFTPPALGEETFAVPGAVGGSNWGNTAADPVRGRVYVLNQDFPSIYKLETGDARARERAGSRNARERASGLYALHCQVCHGDNRQGSLGPALTDLGGRVSYQEFHEVITSGRAQMPALPHLDESAIQDLYQLLAGDGPVTAAPPQGADETTLPTGPVVASGGAPGAGERPPAAAPIDDYPQGVAAPSVRYTTGYGLGHPYLMRPPWSTLSAYDLNTGEMLWQIPVGQDLLAAQAGGRDTGVPRGAQRNGMIVTSTGLVFSTAKDGHLYAFDADTGETVWKARLPMGTEGLPALYSLNGRSHLVVNATTPLTWGRASRESGIGGQREPGQGAYVVFALPERSPADAKPAGNRTSSGRAP